MYSKERYITEEQYLISQEYLLEEVGTQVPNLKIMFQAMDAVSAAIDHLKGENEVVLYSTQEEDRTPLRTPEEIIQFWQESYKVICDIMIPFWDQITNNLHSKMGAAVQVIHARTVEIRIQIDKLKQGKLEDSKPDSLSATN